MYACFLFFSKYLLGYKVKAPGQRGRMKKQHTNSCSSLGLTVKILEGKGNQFNSKLKLHKSYQKQRLLPIDYLTFHIS